MYVVLDLGRTDRKQSGSSSNGAEPQAQSSATSTVKAPSGSSGTPKAAQRQQQRQDPLAEVEFASVQLREGIDTVILGSVGLWCATLVQLRRLRFFHRLHRVGYIPLLVTSACASRLRWVWFIPAETCPLWWRWMYTAAVLLSLCTA